MIKLNNKNKKNPFCDFSFFMKQGCRGCKRQRSCEEYESKFKRNSINRINNDTICVSDDKSKKRLFDKTKSCAKKKTK